MDITIIDHPKAATALGYQHPDPRIGKIADLSVIRGVEGFLWSAWKPTFKERIEILFGRCIWLGVQSYKQPVVCMTIAKTPEEFTVPQAVVWGKEPAA